MVATPKENEATTTAPADAGVEGSENTEGTTPDVNPEDMPMPEAQEVPKAKNPVPPQFAKKAVAKTFAEYIAAGEKPPKEMVSTPTQMKEYLLAFPKVKVIAPLSSGEKKGEAYETVKLNGVEQTFKKGVFVELPEPMAKLVMDHYELADTNCIDTELRGKANKAQELK